MARFVLMNPGPVNVHETVRAALGGDDQCHRESEYFDLQDRVREKLLTAFGLPGEEWAPVIVTGSGTCALEAAVVSSVPEGGRMLVAVNGVYGDRIAKMAEAAGIEHERVESGWLEPPDLDRLETRLEEGAFDVLAAVHHETTTGMRNPIVALGELAAVHGADLLLDSISGLAGESFDFDAVRPTQVVCTANKCVEGLPGISFVLVRREHLERMADVPPRSLYLWLPGYFSAQEKRGTPFTPAIQIMEALDVALDRLIEETVAGRIARYAEASRILRAGFADLGLALLLPEKLRSNTITSVRLPEGIGYDALHDALRERGYVIYAGQGRLRDEAFRVANMGRISVAELEGLAGSLREVIEALS